MKLGHEMSNAELSAAIDARQICSDCGDRPVWWYALRVVSLGYCRECASKGGHDYLTRRPIDPDKLVAAFQKISATEDEARARALDFLAECASDS